MPAPLDDVWAVVGDPHHLPRWWPLTERVEAVDPQAWTSVLRSTRSNGVPTSDCDHARRRGGSCSSTR